MATAREAAAQEGGWHFERALAEREEAQVRAAYLRGEIDTDEYLARVERIYEYAQQPPAS